MPLQKPERCSGLPSPKFASRTQCACKFGRRPQLCLGCFCRRQRLGYAATHSSLFLPLAAVCLLRGCGDARSKSRAPQPGGLDTNNAGASLTADPRRGTLSFVTQKFFCFGAINNRRNYWWGISFLSSHEKGGAFEPTGFYACQSLISIPVMVRPKSL